MLLVEPHSDQMSPQSIADLFSGDPELERHCPKLWFGQLEGGSRCSAHLRSPRRFCLPVRWVVFLCSSSLFLLGPASPSLFPSFYFSVANLTHILPVAIILSFSSADILGGRLENEKTEKCCLQACLCYICSGNIERLVECWTSHRDSSSPLGLEVYSFSRLDKASNQLITLSLQF